MKDEIQYRRLRQNAFQPALQMLYAVEMAAQAPDQVEVWYLDAHPLPPAEVLRVRKLLRLAVENRERIAALVDKHARDWRWQRLAVIDRSILLVATGALLETSSKAAASSIIHDALVLAYKYSQPNVLEFMRGLLEAVAADVRVQEALLPAGE